MEARMSNLALYRDDSGQGSSNLLSEVMAMTRALFSSLETRVARLEQCTPSKAQSSDQAFQNRLTSLERRMETQFKEVVEHSAENKKYLEGQISSAEEDLCGRIDQLERQSNLEERMSRLEKAVASLEASRFDQALVMERIAAIEKQLQSFKAKPGSGSSSALGKTGDSLSLLWETARLEERKAEKQLQSFKAMPESAMNRLSLLMARSRVATPQPDESAFPQRKAIVLQDHRGCILRRGRLGKLIAPHPKSPASNSVPEQLVFRFDKKRGGFLVHSLSDGKRLLLSSDGLLYFDSCNSPAPTNRELFFVIPNKGHVLIGSLHTNSYVYTQDELCQSKATGIESTPEKAKFRISCIVG